MDEGSLKSDILDGIPQKEYERLNIKTVFDDINDIDGIWDIKPVYKFHDTLYHIFKELDLLY